MSLKNFGAYSEFSSVALMGPPGDGDTVILTFFRGDMVIFAEKCKRCGDIGKIR